MARRSAVRLGGRHDGGGSGSARASAQAGTAAIKRFASTTRAWLVRLARSRSAQDVRETALKGVRLAGLPLKIRPAFVGLTFLVLVLLSLLGFHPTLADRLTPDRVPFSDKILHFVCFYAATALFFWIWHVDEHARRVWYWRSFPELVSIPVCILAGGVGSEFVQALLPYKTFQWGDVAANVLGASLGLLTSRSLAASHRRWREIRRLYQPISLAYVETAEAAPRRETRGYRDLQAATGTADSALNGDDDDDDLLSTSDEGDVDANDPWMTSGRLSTDAGSQGRRGSDGVFGLGSLDEDAPESAGARRLARV